MKMLALALVMVGTGLAAAFGARNVDALKARQEVTGRAALLAREEARLEAALEDPELSADDRAALAAEREALTPRLTAANEDKAAIPREAVPASARLEDWLAHNGLPFGLGIALILAGGLLTRRLNRLAAAGDSGQSGGAEAVDFGTKLEATAERLRALAAEMDATAEPSALLLEPLRDKVEAIVRDDIEPLVETRQQVINRFGMAGFAQLFGPLSGAERSLNRAWVAMVDRHWEEARASLGTAEARLSETRAELTRLTQPG